MQCYKKNLSATSIDRQWGLYVTSLGYMNYKASNSDDQKSRQTGLIPSDYLTDDSYYIVFIVKGDGTISHPYHSFGNVSSGSCLLLFPGVSPLCLRDLRSDWKMYWIGFNGSYAIELMNGSIFSDKKLMIGTGMIEQVLTLFETVVQKVWSTDMGYRQVISGLTLQILALLYTASAYEAELVDPRIKMISKAKYLLHQSLESPVKLEEVASELRVSYSKFRREFKEITGQSPNQYQIDLRLNRAQNLLLATSMTINEIAYQTGFDSIFHFSKFFKKKFGLSPKYYRMNQTELITGT